MFKQGTIFMFRNSIDWSVSYLKDFETKTDFDQWMDERLKEGLVYIGENRSRRWHELKKWIFTKRSQSA